MQQRQREERLRETHDPREAHQQQNAGDERERKPQATGLLLLRERKFSGENRDEDDVIDPENDFQSGEREQRNPNRRISEPVHMRRISYARKSSIASALE